MFIIMVPPYKDEGRHTDLTPNHTATLEFDKIRNSDNYSDVSNSSYETVGLGDPGEGKRFTERSNQAVGFDPPQSAAANTKSDVSVS